MQANNGNQAMVAGSLEAVAKKNNASIATGFLSVKCLVMVDVSASMGANDTTGGRSRYQAACEQLAALQGENPGEVGVCAFSNRAEFCPGGVPVNMHGGTDMKAALRMLKMADGCGIRMILISDGEPDDAEGTLREASRFTSKIDTIYIGPETGEGREFLRKLSQATGGISITNATADMGKLSDNITMLLGA
jgi:Mg-chelatase subunit ChlD